jgi:hypothetical protein
MQNQIKVTTHILTDFFYDNIAPLYDIDVEETPFVIIATVEDGYNSHGEHYDLVGIEGIELNGEELDLKIVDTLEVLSYYQCEILDWYYNDLANGLLSKPYDLNLNRKGLALMSDIISNGSNSSVTIYDTDIAVSARYSFTNFVEAIESFENNIDINRAIRAAKLTRICERKVLSMGVLNVA